MPPWERLFRRPFVVSTLVFVGSSCSAWLLRGTVIACTVGFSTSNQPIGAALASQCTGTEIASALLITAALLSAVLAVWFGARAFFANSNVSTRDRPVSSPAESERGPVSRTWLAKLLGWPTFNWVCLFAALFFAATFFAASWQYLHLAVVNYLYDLVINQQALSSTALGSKPYVFYEAINCGRHGQCSFLLVHQAFVAYPATFLYEVAPTPFTLFALQSLALCLAALPLYLLAIDVLHSRRWSLVVAGTYLVWMPLFMMATHDSFHWEAFLPLEMITIFWLWNRQRYLAALPVVLLAFVTEEVTPVLSFFVGLYFACPWLVKGIRTFWNAITVPSAGTPGTPSRIRLWFRSIRTALHVPEVNASLMLMAGSIAAYVLLRLFEQYGGSFLGVPQALPGYVLGVGSPNRSFVLTLAALSFQWTAKVWYWIVVLLTLGFVPIFAPRSLILVLPWVLLTSFNVTPGFWNFGNQYPTIPAAALLIGFTMGLGQLLEWASARAARRSSASSSPNNPRGGVSRDARVSAAPTRRRWTLSSRLAHRPPTAVLALSIATGAVIGGNLVLNPLSPVGSSIVPTFGPPFPPIYGLESKSSQNDQALLQLVSLVPKNAVVAAPLPVYTLVADDPYAYPLTHWSNPPMNLSLLPDNESARVQFVVLPYDTPNDEIYPALWNTLYDRSDFGVRGCISDSVVGGVELFERNYTGQPEVFGPAGPLCPNYFAGGTGLTPGPNSTLQVNASSPTGVDIRSEPCVNNSTVVNTVVFSGPALTLPAGKYEFTVVLNAIACLQEKYPSDSTLLSVNVAGNGSSGPESNITTSLINLRQALSSACGSWQCGVGRFSLTSAMTSLSMVGTVELKEFVVQVACIVIQPVD